MFDYHNRALDIPREGLSPEAVTALNRTVHAAMILCELAYHNYDNSRDRVFSTGRYAHSELEQKKISMAEALVQLVTDLEVTSPKRIRSLRSWGVEAEEASASWAKVIYLLTGIHGERDDVKNLLLKTFPAPPNYSFVEQAVSTPDAELTGAVQMLASLLRVVRAGNPTTYQDFLTPEIQQWGPKQYFGFRWEQRLTEMLTRLSDGISYPHSIQGLKSFAHAPWGADPRSVDFPDFGFPPIWARRNPRFDISNGSVTKHSLSKGHQGECTLSPEQASFLRDFIRDEVIPRVYASGDHALARYLSVDNIGAGGQVGMTKVTAMFKHGPYSQIGGLGSGPNPFEGGVAPLIISLATELLEAAHSDSLVQKSDFAPRELLAETIIHEANHVLDKRDQRLAELVRLIDQDASIPADQRGRYRDHIAEMSAYGRTAACFDGEFVADTRTPWAGAFLYRHKVGGGEVVATVKTTSLCNMTIPADALTPRNPKSEPRNSRPFDEYVGRLFFETDKRRNTYL